MILAARFYGPVVRWGWRTTFIVFSILHLVGIFFVTILSCCSPFTGSLWCLIAAHAVKGQGHGLILTKAREHINACLKAEEMQGFVLKSTIACNLGFALGTIGGSFAVPICRGVFLILGMGHQDLNPAAYANIVLLMGHALVFMPIAIAMLPLKLHREGVDTSDESRERYVAVSNRVRKINVAIGFLIVLFKDSVSAAIEVFDVLMLEVEYRWSVETSGFFAGAAMGVACLPLVLYSVFEKNIPARVNIWIHRSSFIAFLTCSLAAFPGVCPFSLDSYCVLFMWVFRVVNYMFWGIGMSFVEGGLFRWALPDEKHWCSLKNIAFMQTFLMEGITRSVGPFLVRAFYEHGGRFAACMFLTCCEAFVAVTVFIGLVIPYGKYWT